ncbi:UDP-glucose-sterol transferase [Penicillium viridicatum]|nr:UDP-glucose-sterol transferase [Penicillium viridicatum]
MVSEHTRRKRVFDQKVLVHLPNHLSWEEAACINCAGTTSWKVLDMPRAGGTALLQGTGGVSMFALLICLAAGIQPIITSSSDKKLEIVRALGKPGAAQTINYTTHPDWDEQARHLTCGRGVDVVVDNVGPTATAQTLSSLARGGLVSLVGFLGGFNIDKQPDVLGPVLLKSATGSYPVPSLNIVIQIVGSRGDAQPFAALGLALKRSGHRVRIATHPTFKSFIEDLDLEFFSIGGDSMKLMAYMVKNPGHLPNMGSLRSGHWQQNRVEIREILDGCWRSCYATDDGLDRSKGDNTGKLRRFVANAIIANPPSFAHLHCAEKLGIPLHMMFTMPWSPTQAFPPPLANIKSSSLEPKLANYLSHILVETLTWQGLGDIINSFRRKSLGLEPVDVMSAPTLLPRLRIPQTYCWSAALIPQPKDWGEHISVSGFYFLPLVSTYSPPATLEAFLNNGPPPIYIGFGSIVLDDPDFLTALLIEAVHLSGGIVPTIGFSKEYHVLFIMAVLAPQLHLSPRGRCRTRANPVQTASNLATAIQGALKPQILSNAHALGVKVGREKGVEAGVNAFHQQIHSPNMSCSIYPSRAAAWRVCKTEIILSPCAAAILMEKGLLDREKIEMWRPCKYDLNLGPWEPVSGTALAALDSATQILNGFEEIGTSFVKPFTSDHTTSESSSTQPRQKTRYLGLKGIGRASIALVRAPVKVGVALTQGLHSAPKLWGDRTVRPQEAITSIGSGFKAACKELFIGTYDGVAGLVMQPYLGAHRHGFLGAFSGHWIGGLSSVVKTAGGLVGFVSYPLKGIDAEITKRLPLKLHCPVEDHLIGQGQAEVAEEDRVNLVHKWSSLTSSVKKTRLKTRAAIRDKRKEAKKERQNRIGSGGLTS